MSEMFAWLLTGFSLFYVYCSVHRWSMLVAVQREATQSSLFIILQDQSTCFGCQPHPSSVHKTVTTASGIVQLPLSNVDKLVWLRWREVAAQYQRLYLQFCVLLMISVVDTRNM